MGEAEERACFVPRPENRMAGFHAAASCALLNDRHPRPMNAYSQPITPDEALTPLPDIGRAPS